MAKDSRAINDIGIDGMERDFPGMLRELLPLYTSQTSASAVFRVVDTSVVDVRGDPRLPARCRRHINGACSPDGKPCR
jgi:hypothetical protein